ncbi:taste receptor type 2 member 3 [Eptesicus fuscus]|uniref:taste receptor type 2 member 3 n=1 Tax=Eptesicus fuscus TaxID=29078 RepID=UPI00046B7BA3|nr:taste receptor type 2 member 3 [Eptesicus fuscus]
MSGLTKWVFLFLSVTLFVLGMLVNVFIVLVNGSSWVKSKKISLSDFIITNLALSRIVQLWILLFDCVKKILLSKLLFNGVLLQVTDIFWTFTNHLSIWLATCLGVFYCLKIANFSHPTFLWLKWRVARVVVWMLLGGLLLSCGDVMSLIHEFKIYYVLQGANNSGNVTEHFRELKNEYEVTRVLGTLWKLLPLIVCLASYILLILSLGKHTRQMQQNRTSLSDPSTEAHKRAIKMVLSFFLLLLFYFLAYLLTSFQYFLQGTVMTELITEVSAMFYPACHSCILILGNSKLKQTFVELLWCKSGHLKPGSKERFSP